MISVAIVLALLSHVINGANILGVFQHPGYSHFKMFHPILRGLADKGHQVTVASYFPDKNAPPNYKDLDMDISHFPHPKITMDMLPPRGFWSNFFEFWELLKWGELTCEEALKSPVIDEILDLHQKKPFDIILVEFFTSDCTLALAHKLNIPFIGLSSCALFPWHYDRVGLPDTPSYIPTESVRFSQKMDFWQRLENWIVVKGTKYLARLIDWNDNRLIRARFGDDIPDVAEIALKTSLILVNQHFSLSGPRPLTPGVIEVGGVHINKDNNLPEDMKDILDNAKNGVILISMGSLISGDSLPDEKREAILNILKSRKETIIWKWESEQMKDKPDNVILKKWVPQKDILCHPNVKAFMAHGGLLGITEATYCGVPTIVMPFYGDQFLNAAAAEQRGLAIIQNYHDLNEENLRAAFEKVTSKK
jgi:glucuronosyltransferase